MEIVLEYFGLPLSVYEWHNKDGSRNRPRTRRVGESKEVIRFKEDSDNISESKTLLVPRKTRKNSNLDAYMNKKVTFEKELMKKTRNPPLESISDVLVHIKSLVTSFWVESNESTRKDAWRRLLLIVLLQICRAKISTVLSWTNRMQIATLGNLPEFRNAVTMNILAILCLSPIEVLHARCLYSLRVKWTQHLTSVLLRRYVQTQCKEKFNVENMDQHISEDVDKFVGLFMDLSLESLQACLHLYFFSKLLWKISPALSFSSVFCSILGTCLTAYVGKNLPLLHFYEREAENDFRYALTRVRENAESIAFYKGEQNEYYNLEERHSAKLYYTWKRKSYKDTVALFSSVYRKVFGMLPGIMLSQKFVKQPSKHNHDHSHEHNHQHNHSHILPTIRPHNVHGHSHDHGHSHSHDQSHNENFNDFSRLKTVARELYDLDIVSRHAVESLKRENESYDSEHIVISELDPETSENNAWMELDNVSVGFTGADGNYKGLIHNLFIKLETKSSAAHSMLITGPSGVGKTTLLRAIAGIWSEGQGIIHRPLKSKLMFIPQKSYLCLGSLRAQLLYPRTEHEFFSGDFLPKKSDRHIEQALEKVNLPHLLHRDERGLDAVDKWSEVLSVGEQQRIAFARMLISEPEFIILDEATSACDEKNEILMYQLVASTCTAWISVGHRTSIERFHESKLMLKHGGSWDFNLLKYSQTTTKNHRL